MKLVVLYGPPAVGKYTIGCALAEKTGYKLFHNHLSADLLRSVFDTRTTEVNALIDQIRLEVLELAAKENVPGVIFTFVYSDSEGPFVQELQKRITAHGGEIVFVQLSCEKDELLNRVTSESRKPFHKIQSREVLEEILHKDGIQSSIPFVPSFQVDTTSLSVEQVVERIVATLD